MLKGMWLVIFIQDLPLYSVGHYVHADLIQWQSPVFLLKHHACVLEVRVPQMLSGCMSWWFISLYMKSLSCSWSKWISYGTFIVGSPTRNFWKDKLAFNPWWWRVPWKVPPVYHPHTNSAATEINLALSILLKYTKSRPQKHAVVHYML